jgi:hypothetical protein
MKEECFLQLAEGATLVLQLWVVPPDAVAVRATPLAGKVRLDVRPSLDLIIELEDAVVLARALEGCHGLGKGELRTVEGLEVF